MFSDELTARARQVIDAARTKHLRIATAESCTGGLIAALLTEIPGSSDVFECGFVTYSNKAKEQMLGVPASLVEKHGAVSEEVARAMVEGALAHTDLAVAVTGIAGPAGGTAQKPVGLVYIATARQGGEKCVQEFRFGNIGRGEVRIRAVEESLALLDALLG